jgi:hypothetical protein
MTIQQAGNAFVVGKGVFFYKRNSIHSCRFLRFVKDWNAQSLTLIYAVMSLRKRNSNTVKIALMISGGPAWAKFNIPVASW